VSRKALEEKKMGERLSEPQGTWKEKMGE